MWIAASASQVIEQGQIDASLWGNILGLTGLTASMTINALVTGLIVFRIFKVFREVERVTTSDEGVTGRRKLRSIIFIIIESGMALFAIQLTRLVLAFNPLPGNDANDAYQLMVPIHEMVNVIISSILVTLYLTNDMDLTRA